MQTDLTCQRLRHSIITHDKDEEYSSSEDDIALYYRAYSRNKPDIDESNAESTTRTQQIEIDYNHLKRQRQAKHDQRRQKTLKIRITTIENPKLNVLILGIAIL